MVALGRQIFVLSERFFRSHIRSSLPFERKLQSLPSNGPTVAGVVVF